MTQRIFYVECTTGPVYIDLSQVAAAYPVDSDGGQRLHVVLTSGQFSQLNSTWFEPFIKALVEYANGSL